jgi:WD40 repeat protein
MTTSPISPLYLLGLDFGTSNLRLQRAVLSDSGVLVVPPAPVGLLGSSFDALPCVLELTPDGRRLRTYGQAAINDLQVTRSPQNYVQDFKPCLGQTPGDLATQGPNTALFDYSQDDAFRYAELLLERVVANLLTIYGQAPTADNRYQVVAGIPIYWQEDTRLRYRQMLATCFSHDQIQLVPEPEAALNYHLCQRSIPALPPEGRVLTVDFGAGTTDVSLCGISEDGRHLVEPLSYGERYGGVDFDVVLGEYVARSLHMPQSGDRTLAVQLREAGRRLKENYSQSVAQGKDEGSSVHSLMAGDRVYDGLVRLNRDTFESDAVAGILIREFDALLSRALASFGDAAAGVSLVVATGGGAQWYFVQEALKRRFEGFPVVGDQPHKAISMGLAYPSLQIVPPVAGADVSLSLWLSWEEAQRGGPVAVSVAGRAEEVIVPAGAEDGQEVRMPGRGGRGRYGGPAGIFLVTLRVPPAPEPGGNMKRTLTVTREEARLGVDKVLTLDGKAMTVSVPAGAINGQAVHLPGCGLPGRNGGSSGDLVVTLEVSAIAELPPIRGADIPMDLALTPDQARAGGTYSLQVNLHNVQVPIPAGAFIGQKIRLPDAGPPGQNGGSPGDLIVTVCIPNIGQKNVPQPMPRWLRPALIAVGVIALLLLAFHGLWSKRRPLVLQPATTTPIDYTKMQYWKTLPPPGGTPSVSNPDSAISMAFTSNETLAVGYLLVGNWNKYPQVSLWDVQKSVSASPNDLGQTTFLDVNGLAFSPKDQDIAVVGDDGHTSQSSNVLLVYDLSGHRIVYDTLPAKARNYPTSVAYSPDGKYVAVTCGNTSNRPGRTGFTDDTKPIFKGNMTVWDSSDSSSTPVVNYQGEDAWCTSFSNDSNAVVYGRSGYIFQVTLPSQTLTTIFNADNSAIAFTSIISCPDGQNIIAVQRTNVGLDNIQEYNTKTMLPGLSFQDKQAKIAYRLVQAIALSPDGTCLAAGGIDDNGKGLVTLWNTQTGQPLSLVGPPLISHDNQVNTVAFSPDGRTLACGSNDGTVKLWHVP